MNHSTTIPLIGLDIGKNVHVFGVYSGPRLEVLVPPATVYNTHAGFAVFAACVSRLLAQHGQVRLGNEPTGVYYEAWGRAVLNHFADAIGTGRLDYRLVLPNLVKEARQALLRGRYRKTDAIDTAAIARCLLLGEGTPAHFPDAHALLFDQWARHYRRLERDRRRLERTVLDQMDRLWPGAFVNVKRFAAAHPDLEPPVPLVQTRPLERHLVQALLTHCPNPYDVLACTEAEMVAFLRETVGRGGLASARKVLCNARQALLPPPEVAAVYAHALATDWQRYQALAAQLAALETQAETLVLRSPAAVLTTVPGVSALHAARYLAYVQDPHRFPDADHVWAFAGFDPATAQSGDARRVGYLSKRGDPGFRDTLYLIGRHTSQHCPPIKAVFQRAYRRFAADKTPVRATIHAAHAANRLLFRLLVDQVPFDPAYPA